jgi:hypothetical protein
MNEVTAETWPELRDLWNRTLSTSLAVSVATVGEDGAPHVSPIGSLILGRRPGTATMIELFARQMARNLDRDPRVTVLAVDSSAFRFVAALARGRFPRAVATRLSGTAGPRRWASEEEVARFRRRVRSVRRLRGHDLLWGADRMRARDLVFDLEHPVDLGAMTVDLRRRSVSA